MTEHAGNYIGEALIAIALGLSNLWNGHKLRRAIKAAVGRELGEVKVRTRSLEQKVYGHSRRWQDEEEEHSNGK